MFSVSALDKRYHYVPKVLDDPLNIVV